MSDVTSFQNQAASFINVLQYIIIAFTLIFSIIQIIIRIKAKKKSALLWVLIALISPNFFLLLTEYIKIGVVGDDDSISGALAFFGLIIVVAISVFFYKDVADKLDRK